MSVKPNVVVIIGYGTAVGEGILVSFLEAGILYFYHKFKIIN